jgi:hypothetical protein
VFWRRLTALDEEESIELASRHLAHLLPGFEASLLPLKRPSKELTKPLLLQVLRALLQVLRATGLVSSIEV